ncbi:MAG: zinc ribbon domain-containing protein [Hungatella sp.]|nr:zinc ribbon domain-containing protein [Hungatella sp.]
MEILGMLAASPGLVAGILILAGGVFAWFRIRNQVRMISRAMFGTSSLAEGLERQADILAETPKSVSGMTKLCLPQIEADFPEFHWAQWRQMCENMLKAYLEALSSQNLALLERIRMSPSGDGESGQSGLSQAADKEVHEAPAVSEELKKQAALRIDDQRRRGVREIYRQVKIHQTEISRYQKEAGMCIIKLQSAVEYYYEEKQIAAESKGTERKKGTRAESRKKERKEQTRYNMELVYIQDLSKVADPATAVGVTCPNCGAPVTRLGSRFCEYCGTGIIPVDVRVWKLHRVEGETH